MSLVPHRVFFCLRGESSRFSTNGDYPAKKSPLNLIKYSQVKGFPQPRLHALDHPAQRP